MVGSSVDECAGWLAGKRIAIIHYGEHVPLDVGYRPARMGRLAANLVAAGADVERLSPTFSKFAGAQRPESWTGSNTSEGRIQMIATPEFGSSRGLARAKFLRAFGVGAGDRLRALDPIDLAVVGYPPPGVVRSVRAACGPDVKIVADIRDLWPDALMPSDSRVGGVVGAAVGRMLASELSAADAVVSVSDTMLRRSPARNRAIAIPIGTNEVDWGLVESVMPSASDPMRVVFVGTFTQLFDFGPLVDGWREFCSAHDAPLAELTIYGAGDREAEIQGLLTGLPQATFGGWVDSKDVPGLLASADVGVAPTRAGQGTTLSNKVLEYLSVGLHVLHSLEGSVEIDIASPTVARRVADRAEWGAAFADALAGLEAIRDGRQERVRLAHGRYGEQAVKDAWFGFLATQLNDFDNPAVESGDIRLQSRA